MYSIIRTEIDLTAVVMAMCPNRPWPLNDKHPMEDHVRILTDAVTASEAVRFPAALALEHPFTVLYNKAPWQMPGPASLLGPADPRSTGLPPAVWSELSARLSAHPNASFVVRLQNTVAQGGAAITINSLAEVLWRRLRTHV